VAGRLGRTRQLDQVGTLESAPLRISAEAEETVSGSVAADTETGIGTLIVIAIMTEATRVETGAVMMMCVTASASASATGTTGGTIDGGGLRAEVQIGGEIVMGGETTRGGEWIRRGTARYIDLRRGENCTISQDVKRYMVIDERKSCATSRS
jgi:hypothetical protein